MSAHEQDDEQTPVFEGDFMRVRRKLYLPGSEDAILTEGVGVFIHSFAGEGVRSTFVHVFVPSLQTRVWVDVKDLVADDNLWTSPSWQCRVKGFRRKEARKRWHHKKRCMEKGFKAAVKEHMELLEAALLEQDASALPRATPKRSGAFDENAMTEAVADEPQPERQDVQPGMDVSVACLLGGGADATSSQQRTPQESQTLGRRRRQKGPPVVSNAKEAQMVYDMRDIGDRVRGRSASVGHYYDEEDSAAICSAMEAERGLFPNPRNKTCYLGSMLQALLHTSSFLKMCLGHERSEACEAVCAACLLREAAEGTNLPSQTHSLEGWRHYLSDHGFDFDEQHDALEVLQILGHDGILQPLMDSCMSVSGVRQSHAQFPCGHQMECSFTDRFADISVDLRPVPSVTWLHDALAEDGNASPFDGPVCQCGVKSTGSVSYGFVGGRDVFLVGISRHPLPGETLRKNTTSVLPDLVLFLGDKRYALRGIVEHLGEHCNTGHYMCHIRLSSGCYRTYDDANSPIVREQLPDTAYSGSRCYVYEYAPSAASVMSISLAPDKSNYTAAHLGCERDCPEEMAGDCKASGLEFPTVEPAGKLREASSSDLNKELFMDPSCGQERVDKDVKQLLSIYEDGRDCRSFLPSLPMFVSDSHSAKTFGAVIANFDAAITSLMEDQVNSAAALEVRPYIADSLVYPFYVLMEATSRALSIPPLFLVDNVTALLHSVLHKHTYVKLGRWKSKSRHWWVGVANVGEGKSEGMKAFTDDMVDALHKHSAFAVGSADDRYHFQQSGTAAGAIDKLRACAAYLTVYCSDAGRCLSRAAAVGTAADPHKHIDMEYFLDAAHGDEFNHSTKVDRQRVLAKRVRSQDAPAEPPEALHLDPTNVHFMFLIQNLFFQTWFAQIAEKHPVGIPQRCLFSFGGRPDELSKLQQFCFGAVFELWWEDDPKHVEVTQRLTIALSRISSRSSRELSSNIKHEEVIWTQRHAL